MRLAILFSALLALLPSLEAQQMCDPCTFEWDAPTNLTGIVEYRLLAKPASDPNYDFSSPRSVVPVTETTTSAGGLAPGTYTAIVVSSDGANISRPSNEVDFIVPLPDDQTPGGLSIRITATARLNEDGSIDSTIHMEVEPLRVANR